MRTDGFLEEKKDPCEHWDHVLSHAGPRDHVVQLYQDQDFLNRAVCRFAGAALANGEGLILVPTAEHWNAFRPRLEAEGVDVRAAQDRGQLTVVDADETLPRFMGKTLPDGPVFLGLAGEIIRRTRAAGSYPKVRWWGEMVNVLWERGDVAASMNLEDLFDRVAHEQDIAIFCSFVMDNFDGEIHTHMLPRLGRTILTLFRSKTMRAWNARWQMHCVRSWARTRPECLKVSCCRSIRRLSTCRAHKRCCWRCVRPCRRLLSQYCSAAAIYTSFGTAK